MAFQIKKGDSVIVTAGKNLGQQAKVLRVLPGERKVVVEGVNLVKKRERPRREGQKGQTLERAMPIAVSNILLFCSSCGQGVRFGAKISGTSKVRICRSCGKEI